MNLKANHAELSGLDTDQFPRSYYETTLAMLTILKVGGFTTGGLNFDARIIADGKLAAFVKNRYASYDKGKGALFAKGKMGFADLAALAKDYGTVGIAINWKRAVLVQILYCCSG